MRSMLINIIALLNGYIRISDYSINSLLADTNVLPRTQDHRLDYLVNNTGVKKLVNDIVQLEIEKLVMEYTGLYAKLQYLFKYSEI